MGHETDLVDPPAGAEAQGSFSGRRAAHLTVSSQFKELVQAARDGSSSAQGCLFEEFRNYLLLIANRQLGQSIQSKIGASDVVQETLLQAHLIFDRFQGTSWPELAAWLSQILDFKLAQTKRHFVHTEKRATNQENPRAFASHEVLGNARLPHVRLPDEEVARCEELEIFQRALERLSPDYRLAIEIRGLQQKPFNELARALHRSSDAARMVWCERWCVCKRKSSKLGQ